MREKKDHDMSSSSLRIDTHPHSYIMNADLNERRGGGKRSEGWECRITRKEREEERSIIVYNNYESEEHKKQRIDTEIPTNSSRENEAY